MSLVALDLPAFDQYSDWTFTFPTLLAGQQQIPIDFTDCTATMAWRVTPLDSASTIAISTTPGASGSIVLGPAVGPTGAVGPGTIQANVNRVALGAPISGVTMLRYDLIITWSNGQRETLFSGSQAVNQGADY